MKKLLFVLLMLPFAAFSQVNSDSADFEGWVIPDCQKFAIRQLTRMDKGVLKDAAAGRITANTKTIYIAKQKWLSGIPDTLGGMNIKFIDIDSNLAMLANEVKKNGAAVYYISPFEVKSTMCEMWIFPVDIKKKSKEFSTTAYKMNFFFNYDPPKYQYRGTEKVVL